MSAPLPCPFCGCKDIAVVEGSTFRWRLAQCNGCGAQGPDVRIQTSGSGTKEEWEQSALDGALTEWNRRHAEADLAAERADIREMVEKAADNSLEGYRELGARAAAAENERDSLRAHLHDEHQRHVGTMDERDAALADLAAARADAERYRWLRNKHEYNANAANIVQEVSGEGWDAAIDAALKEQK